MALVNQGGSLLLRNGALATGQACCCKEKGCCCINGEAVQGFSEQECEACNTTYTCSEFMQLEDPSQPCPEGWQPGGEGFCLRSTVVESCEQCAGTCLTQQTGNCGTWIEGSDTCAGYQGFAQVTEPSGTICQTHDCHTFYVGPNGVFRAGQVFPVFDWCDDDPIDPDPNADNSGRLSSFQKAGFFENQEECDAALQAAMEDNPPPEGCVFYNFYCVPANICPNAFP